MARADISSGKFALTDASVEAIAVNVAKLLTKHAEALSKAVNHSDEKALTVNIAVEIDDSSSASEFRIRLRAATETLTDKRVVRADDKDQHHFTGMSMEELAALEAKAAQAEKEQGQASGEQSDGTGTEGSGKRKKK